MSRSSVAGRHVALLAVFALSTGFGHTQLSSLPPRIANPDYTEGGSQPPYAWIAATELFDASGALRVGDDDLPDALWSSDLLAFRRGYERSLAGRVPWPCIPLVSIIDFARLPHERWDLAELMAQARACFVAR